MRNLSRTCLAATSLLLGLAGLAPAASHGNQDRRRPAHPDQRRLALLQRRSRRRRAGRLQRRRLARARPAPRLGHRRSLRPQVQSARWRPALLRRRLVSQALHLPAAAKGKYFSVQFDGAMSNSTVWINGQKVGGRPYGYESFALDLTPYLKFGEENVLAVRLAPEDQSSRWYPGAGIYRNVWLNVTGAVRVAQWGAYITTPTVTDAKATVVVRTDVENQGARKRASRWRPPSSMPPASRPAAPPTTSPSPPAANRPSRPRSTSPTRIAGISTRRTSTAPPAPSAKAPASPTATSRRSAYAPSSTPRTRASC